MSIGTPAPRYRVDCRGSGTEHPMTPLYSITIGALTFSAAPLPIKVRELPGMGATLGCPVNAMARRQDCPTSFGHTLEHAPEFFTFWADEVAETEWKQAGWFQRHLCQYRYVSSLNPNRGLITKAIWSLAALAACFLLPARVDPLAACHVVLREAMMDPTKLRALLQHPEGKARGIRPREVTAARAVLTAIMSPRRTQDFDDCPLDRF